MFGIICWHISLSPWHLLTLLCQSLRVKPGKYNCLRSISQLKIGHRLFPLPNTLGESKKRCLSEHGSGVKDENLQPFLFSLACLRRTHVGKRCLIYLTSEFLEARLLICGRSALSFWRFTQDSVPQCKDIPHYIWLSFRVFAPDRRRLILQNPPLRPGTLSHGRIDRGCWLKTSGLKVLMDITSSCIIQQ